MPSAASLPSAARSVDSPVPITVICAEEAAFYSVGFAGVSVWACKVPVCRLTRTMALTGMAHSGRARLAMFLLMVFMAWLAIRAGC